MSDALNRAAARGIDSYEQEIAILKDQIQKLAEQSQQEISKRDAIISERDAEIERLESRADSNGNRISDKLTASD